jgi:hypothetical protein
MLADMAIYYLQQQLALVLLTLEDRPTEELPNLKLKEPMLPQSDELSS